MDHMKGKEEENCFSFHFYRLDSLLQLKWNIEESRGLLINRSLLRLQNQRIYDQ